MTTLTPPTSGTTGRPSTPRASSSRGRRHGLHHVTVAGWLAAALGVSFAHPFVAHPRWLLVHLLLLGAVSSAVMIWSGHFAETLLRRPPARPGTVAARLGALNLGAITVVIGVVTDHGDVVAIGATVVAGAAVAHAAALARTTRRTLPGRFAVVVRYYVAAALMLPVGALLGALLAGDPDGEVEARLRLAHEVVNVLGWIGLTVTGTLITLWPTMLRTRIAEGAEQAARRALPLLLTGIGLTAGAALVGPPWAAVPGPACYLAGLVVVARPLLDAARRRPPHSVATWSVLAGAGWLATSLGGLVVVLLTGGTWVAAGERVAVLTAPLAVGWVAQTLFGALTYLVPVLIGGGPRVARATGEMLDHGGAARVTATNLALAVAVLPVPGAVRVVCASVVLVLLGTFPALILRAALVGRSMRRAGPDGTPATPPSPPTRDPRPAEPRRHPWGGAAAGLAVVVAAVAVGGAIDPAGLPAPAPATAGEADTTITPTGRTTTVAVEARGMRFSPARVDVPAGDRLVVVLHNADDDRHDLVLSNGTRTPRVAPGRTVTLDAGVVGADLDGWCSVVGHRQMGMVLTVHAVGAVGGSDAASASAHAMPGTARAVLDPMATPQAGFAARDARLDPAPTARLHRRTITVREVEREVAPGVRQKAWTFDGTVPGPVLHGRVGDTFEITLVNAADMGHSIDFHAGSLAPGSVMRTIQPGESLVYRFVATRSGIWMYHCSTMPMSLHIANGMFGAVVIDPPGLAPVAREYVLLQSELYLGPPGGTSDVAAIRAERPDAVVFNGYPAQYVARPLPAAAGERVRVWVLAAGPDRGTAFHVVGGQFDTVYAEGAYRLRPGDPGNPGDTGGAQVLDLGPAAGGFVELTFPEAGTYPFVSHAMVDAERGARGAFAVTAPPSPSPSP